MNTELVGLLQVLLDAFALQASQLMLQRSELESRNEEIARELKNEDMVDR